MEFSKRMRASMLIVIMFCMMCVASVFTRETQLSEAENEQEAHMYAVCETRY